MLGFRSFKSSDDLRVNSQLRESSDFYYVAIFKKLYWGSSSQKIKSSR